MKGYLSLLISSTDRSRGEIEVLSNESLSSNSKDLVTRFSMTVCAGIFSLGGMQRNWNVG